MTGLFEIDSEGFISQQRGREPYEVIREAVQNALDTGSDIQVIVDYVHKTVTVKDSYEEGVKDLDELWTLFEGDKRGNPEERGRFGRGVKELVASSEYVSITTTGGTVEFDVENRERTVDEDETVEVGTEVQATNSNWTNNQLTDVRDFIEKIWVPEDVQITVRSIRDGKESTTTHKREEPDETFETRLDTVVADDEGVMREEQRDTSVHVKKDNSGGIYEMGIPVTTQEDFSFILDVQQKIPMAEQRDEPKSLYKSNLIRQFINNCLDLLDHEDLKQDWVTEEVTSHRVDREVKESYIERRHPSRFSKGNVVSSEPFQDDFARQKGYNVLRTNRFSISYSNMLERHLKSSEDIYKEFEDEVVDEVDPDSEQQKFLDFITDTIISKAQVSAKVKIGRIEGEPDTAAKEQGGVITLNEANRDWTKIDPDNIGVVIHELAHTRSDSDEHDLEFIHDLQELSGALVLHHSKSLF